MTEYDRRFALMGRLKAAPVNPLLGSWTITFGIEENYMAENENRLSLLERLKAAPVNLSSGRWAVARVGMKGWDRDFAIGDGITSAGMALLTRCPTSKEATALADAWNDAQPNVLPGSPSVFIYAARKYVRHDYIDSQNIGRNQCRDCDRRIC